MTRDNPHTSTRRGLYCTDCGQLWREHVWTADGIPLCPDNSSLLDPPEDTK